MAIEPRKEGAAGGEAGAATAAGAAVDGAAASGAATVGASADGPPDPRLARIMTALQPVVLAHNRASLAGALVGYVLAVASVIGAGVGSFISRGLGVALLGFAVVAAWRAVAFHRMVIYDTGPGRRDAARLLDALLARGGRAALEDLAPALDAATLVAALELLGRLGVVFAYSEDGADRLAVDRFRLPPDLE